MNRKKLSFLNTQLIDEITKYGATQIFPKGTQLLKEGQSVKVVPIVLSGLVKVCSRFEERELLLYYIEPQQSCIMTFYAALNNESSKVFAVTEEDTEVLLLPVRFLSEWIKQYSDFNNLFYSQFNLRYTELLDTIKHLLVDKMDKRLYEHLKRKSELTGGAPIQLSHLQIANELGTAREVISRLLKKLENEGLVKLTRKGIKIPPL